MFCFFIAKDVEILQTIDDKSASLLKKNTLIMKIMCL